mmetsp:Transcript_28232/g.81643  ORF Transcript_28232/g.81643 Transcript_28232/m.81643 type:complete len:85 (-) Transcript_28232:334-588(-)
MLVFARLGLAGLFIALIVILSAICNTTSTAFCSSVERATRTSTTTNPTGTTTEKSGLPADDDGSNDRIHRERHHSFHSAKINHS